MKEEKVVEQVLPKKSPKLPKEPKEPKELKQPIGPKKTKTKSKSKPVTKPIETSKTIGIPSLTVLKPEDVEQDKVSIIPFLSPF
jgi:hypothetical protein